MPQALAGLPHAAFEHRSDVEGVADFAQVDALALERERRGAGGDLECLDARQRVHQLFGDAVREIFLLGIIAHVDERQHRQCCRAGGRRLRARSRASRPARRRQCRASCRSKRTCPARAAATATASRPTTRTVRATPDASGRQERWTSGLGPLHALGRELESPGNHQRDRQAEDDEEGDGPAASSQARRTSGTAGKRPGPRPSRRQRRRGRP